MIKAIIFDMDGVIIDSEPLWDEMDEIFLGRRGLKPSAEYLRWAKGRKEKEVVLFLKKKYGVEGSIKEIAIERMEIIMELMKKKLKLMPGFLPLVIRLREKYPIALASSSDPKTIAWVMRKFKIKKYFDLFVSGKEVKRAKPYPDIFLKTAKRLNIEPSGCLVIEDTLNGVVAAKRARMKCIALKHYYMRYQDLKWANKIVKSLREIDLKWIERLSSD